MLRSVRFDHFGQAYILSFDSAFKNLSIKQSGISFIYFAYLLPTGLLPRFQWCFPRINVIRAFNIKLCQTKTSDFQNQRPLHLQKNIYTSPEANSGISPYPSPQHLSTFSQLGLNEIFESSLEQFCLFCRVRAHSILTHMPKNLRKQMQLYLPNQPLWYHLSVLLSPKFPAYHVQNLVLVHALQIFSWKDLPLSSISMTRADCQWYFSVGKYEYKPRYTHVRLESSPHSIVRYSDPSFGCNLIRLCRFAQISSILASILIFTTVTEVNCYLLFMSS